MTKLRSYHWNLQWFHAQILSKFDDLRNVTSSKHCGHGTEVLQHVLEIVHRSWKSESEWCSLLWANHWMDWFSRPVISSIHGICMYNKHPIQPGLEATLGHPSKGCKIEIAHLPVLAPGVSGKTQRNVRIQHSSYCFTRNLPINHLMLSCPIFPWASFLVNFPPHKVSKIPGEVFPPPPSPFRSWQEKDNLVQGQDGSDLGPKTINWNTGSLRV